MSQSKTYCSAVYNAISVRDQSGSMAPCCDLDLSSIKKQHHQSIDDYIENDLTLKNIIDSINKGEWFSGCGDCKNLEDSGLKSSRQDFNEKYHDLARHTFDIRYVEYRPSNLCNLKCRMCHPMDSSLIAKEVQQNPELLTYQHYLPHHVSGSFKNLDIDYFKNLDHLKVLGGEPSIDTNLHNWLHNIINKSIAKNVKLSLTSNFTNLNDSWCDILNEFRSVSISISIDGAGDTFEYIRTPARWNYIKNNILDSKHKIHNLRRVSINFVNSLYNCFTIKEWYPEFKEILDYCNDDSNILTSKKIYCPSACDLPQNFKQIVLGDIDYCIKLYGQSEFLHQYKKRILTQSNIPLRKFFSYSKELDRIRGTNLYNLSPIYQQLEDYVNK